MRLFLNKLFLHDFWDLETKELSIIQSVGITVKFWVMMIITIIVIVLVSFTFGNTIYGVGLILIILPLSIYLIVRNMLKNYLVPNVKRVKEKLSVKHYFLVPLMVFGLYLISTSTLYRVSSYIPDFGFLDVAKNSYTNVGTNAQVLFINLFSIFSTTLVAPIVEEIIFRKIIFRGLLQKYTTRTALIASTLIFAFYHISLQQSISVIPIAFIIGYIYLKTSSIMLCIIAHGFHNLLCDLANISIINFNNIEYFGVLILGITILAFSIKSFRRSSPSRSVTI